jgi:hypothetical protein
MKILLFNFSGFWGFGESDKKLKQMVQEAKDDQLISEFEEEAEDEQIEPVDDE